MTTRAHSEQGTQGCAERQPPPGMHWVIALGAPAGDSQAMCGRLSTAGDEPACPNSYKHTESELACTAYLTQCLGIAD